MLNYDKYKVLSTKYKDQKPKTKTLIPEIRFDHLRIVLDLLREAECNRLSVIDNLNPFADAHHNLHVVFDEQNRQTKTVSYLFYETHQIFLFGWIHSCRRLV